MIRLEKITVRAGQFSLVEVSLEIGTGQYGVLMGRTGSGKTTLLETICGLRRPSSGQVFLMGQDVTDFKPACRGIGYVPQDPTLFGTLTVRQNLAFAPFVRGWPRKEVVELVSDLSELLHIEHLLDRKPGELSGGEAQRVSLGRALAGRPNLLCLDEPLSALDDETRSEMQQVLRNVRERWQITALHVTHHSNEARSLADRILVLRDGRVELLAQSS